VSLILFALKLCYNSNMLRSHTNSIGLFRAPRGLNQTEMAERICHSQARVPQAECPRLQAPTKRKSSGVKYYPLIVSSILFALKLCYNASMLTSYTNSIGLFRAPRGLSQTAAAESIGCCHAWLSQAERRNLEPANSDLDKLTQARRVDTSFLTNDTERPES
jgi:hypothetical protein